MCPQQPPSPASCHFCAEQFEPSQVPAMLLLKGPPFAFRQSYKPPCSTSRESHPAFGTCNSSRDLTSSYVVIRSTHEKQNDFAQAASCYQGRRRLRGLRRRADLLWLTTREPSTQRGHIAGTPQEWCRMLCLCRAAHRPGSSRS